MTLTINHYSLPLWRRPPISLWRESLVSHKCPTSSFHIQTAMVIVCPRDPRRRNYFWTTVRYSRRPSRLRHSILPQRQKSCQADDSKPYTRCDSVTSVPEVPACLSMSNCKSKFSIDAYPSWWYTYIPLCGRDVHGLRAVHGLSCWHERILWRSLSLSADQAAFN